MIHTLLTQAGVGLRDIDIITFTRGPGSFTGIRIGFGVVQGLAFGSDIQVVPVSTLALMAASASRRLPEHKGRIVLPALDARMGEVYLGEYRMDTSTAVPLQPDKIIPVAELQNAALVNPGVVCLGDGWAMSELSQASAAEVITDFFPEAEDLLDIAKRELGKGNTYSIKGLEPLYLRDKVSWKKRKRLRQ